MSKLTKFWRNYKYDILYAILLVMFYLIIFMYSNIQIWNWQCWMLALLIIMFRLIGYNEGKVFIGKAFISNENNVNITIKDNKFDYVITELKNIKTGAIFSLISDKCQTKYLNCGEINDAKYKCWNLSIDAFTHLNQNEKCILYNTKMIYIPNIKLKEDKQ